MNRGDQVLAQLMLIKVSLNPIVFIFYLYSLISELRWDKSCSLRRRFKYDPRNFNVIANRRISTSKSKKWLKTWQKVS